MVFSDNVFLFGFLPLALLLYFAVPRKFVTVRNSVLLASSIVFYAWGEPFYVLVMLGSTCIDYFAGLIMNRFDDKPTARKAALALSIVINLSLLGLFKYGSFVVTNLNELLGTNFFDPELPLPIGISFYTFQSMSYTIDLYKRHIKVQKNPFHFAAFVTLFPQVVAGPIVRYSDVAAELESRTVTAEMFGEGVTLFVRGLCKKVLIANNIGSLWSGVKAGGFADLTAGSAWLGIVAFTLQIYFDFSGYSDMAIGLGKMFGFHFPKNFDYPYLSKSVSEFWRRWHMTLGAWFKSYVYFPLGGSRCSTLKCVRNLAVVWLLTGIWHGAAWNFILWGCFYGLLIIAEKLFLGKTLGKLPPAVGHIYTMFAVIMGWVLFDTGTLPNAAACYAALFGANGGYDTHTLYLLSNYGAVLLVAVLFATPLWQKLCDVIKHRSDKAYTVISFPVLTAMFLLCAAYLADATYNPFLYFNF
ncbi:MAG: MBOAT family protein [Oscillospiraceae bacterium]|jgi:alginate O-acetyltransferase complex protein AlgI|nr:MBOAT family protein [Oscillospiraceae bacterium]